MNRKRPGPPRKGRIVDPKFMAYVATHYPCILRGKRGHVCTVRLTLHHDKECPGAEKNDRRVIPICAGGHLHDFGRESVERLGKRQFQERWRVSFERIIRRQNREYDRTNKNGSERLCPEPNQCL